MLVHDTQRRGHEEHMDEPPVKALDGPPTPDPPEWGEETCEELRGKEDEERPSGFDLAQGSILRRGGKESHDQKKGRRKRARATDAQ